MFIGERETLQARIARDENKRKLKFPEKYVIKEKILNNK